MSDLRDAILAIETETGARFAEQPDGGFLLEAVLAERKTLLSRQKLVYRARVRVDESSARCASGSC